MSAPQPLIPLMLTSTTHPTMPDNMLDDFARVTQIKGMQQQQAQSAQMLPGQLQAQGRNPEPARAARGAARATRIGG